MELSLLIKGVIIGIAVSIPLGAIGVLCIQRTVNKGWKSGFVSGLGAATSDMIYSVVAGLSLGYIIDFIKCYEIYFHIIGAIVLVGMGVYVYRSNPASEIKKYKQKGSSYLSDYFLTFALTISNPLVIFFMLAVFTWSGLALDLKNIGDSICIILGIGLGASMWWCTLTGIVNIFRHKFNLRTLWWMNKIAGGLIIFFTLAGVGYFLFTSS